MADEEQANEESRRPKVVDKRVSSGGHNPTRPTPPTSPPPETKSEGGSGGDAKLASGPPEGESQFTKEDQPVWTPEEEAEAMQMAQEVAERPGIDWVVNTAVTLANVAATKLQIGDPADAQVTIDALAGILNGTTGKLADAEAPLRQTLAQLQVAYAQRVATGGPGSDPGATTGN